MLFNDDDPRAFVQHFTSNVKHMDLNVTAHVREVEVRQDLAFARTWLEVRINRKLWRDANLV